MEKRAEEALVEDDDDDEEERHNYNVKPKTKSTFSKKETRKIKAFSNHLNNKQWWNFEPLTIYWFWKTDKLDAQWAMGNEHHVVISMGNAH